MITNIIEIELLPADRVVTRPVHQWDIGQIIKVMDAEIEDGTPVDFGNRFMKGGLRAYVIDNQVTIPAPALQQERDLTGYVVITDENSETTVKEIAIPVIARPKPEDYVDEEIRESTEFQYVISAVEAVEANAKAAEEAAERAAGSETAAADAKQAAENAATAAAGSANSADGSAKAAAASEQTASGAAATATEKATEAGNSADAAKTSQNEAEKAKSDAESAKDAAKTSEDNAKNHQEAAEQAAADAEDSANDAAGSEQAAKDAADTAETKATEAAGSAEEALNSKNAAAESETNAGNSAKAAADSEAAAKAAQEAAEAAKNEAQSIVELLNAEEKVEYVIPTLTASAYMSTSGAVVSQSEKYAYTEKLSVKEGQIIKAVVNSSSNGGNDMYIAFTTITAYVDGVAKSSLGVNGVGASIKEYIVPESVTEIVVSAQFFTSVYSNPRIEITTPATNSLVTVGYVRNDYSFSLPKTFYMKNGETAAIFLRNLTSPNYRVRLGNYTDSTTIRNTDERCEITANAVANKPISYVVYDEHCNVIEDGTMTLSILGTVPVSQKMLCLGDSFIAMGEIESALRNLFTADGKTLTLIGTKGSGSNLHEGYGGKKCTDFANGFSGSPFGESGFNFANYMSAQGYSGLNSVYIQLGTNDVSPTNPNQDLTDVVDAMKTIVNSIQSYDSSIKIYVGLTVMPNLDSVVFAETYNGTGWNWILKQNMLRLNELIINEYKDSNVKIVATNCVLDNMEDIRDNVHPTTAGFGKMAKQLYNTMSA